MRCNNCIHYDVCYQYDIIGEDDSEMCALYEQKRPSGEWIFKVVFPSGYWECSICKKGRLIVRENFCPNCGASMSANDRQVTGKLNSEIENSKSEIVPDYRDGWRLKEGNVKEAEAKKCPNCGSDLYEHCYMCCYEGKKVSGSDRKTSKNS